MQIKSETLLPPKRMGPLVCVALIEGSSHPHARFLACRECFECVEKIGLSGIGKKGVLAAAKSLSNETLQENRSALLDLMELLVTRMNGDMQRFSRICGPNLSGQARALLEERINKPEKGHSSVPSRSGIPAPASTKRSISRPTPRIQKPKPATSKLSGLKGKSPAKSTPLQDDDSEISASSFSFRDELPALDLRAGLPSGPSGIPRPSGSFRPVGTMGTEIGQSPISGKSYSSRIVSPAKTDQARGIEMDSSFGVPSVGDTSLTNADVELRPRTEDDAVMDLHATSSNESLGAAASLRARLLKIREKNKNPGHEETSDENKGTELHTTQSVDAEDESDALPQDAFRKSHETRIHGRSESDLPQPVAKEEYKQQLALSVDHLDKYLETIRALLVKQTPLEENDEDVVASTDVLKTIHAAVSKQAALAFELDEAGVAHLWDEIKTKANEVVATLTRYVFSIDALFLQDI